MFNKITITEMLIENLKILNSYICNLCNFHCTLSLEIKKIKIYGYKCMTVAKNKNILKLK